MKSTYNEVNGHVGTRNLGGLGRQAKSLLTPFLPLSMIHDDMANQLENPLNSTPSKGLLSRFCDYWWENIKVAKDFQENGLLIVAIVLGLVGLVCQTSDWDNPLAETAKKWSEDSAIIFAVCWCCVWVPFRRHESLNKQINGDDYKLTIAATLSLKSVANPSAKHCELRVSVLNMGKKVGRVERVVAYVSPRNLPNIPVAAGVTVGKAETALRQPEQIMEIQPDGGNVYWELKLASWPKFDIHQKNGQDMGSGYVRLTSGEKLPFEFPMLLPDSQMILELANSDS